MATLSQRRGLQNVNSLRRKLRNMHKVTENSIKPVIEEVAEAIRLDAIDRVPKDTGELARSIEKKVSSDGLTAVIGPGAKIAAIIKRQSGSAFATRKAGGIKLSKASKHLLFQFFKGYWIEFGTKGNAERNIPPQPARPFMGPSFDINRQWGVNRVKDAVNNTLRRVADG